MINLILRMRMSLVFRRSQSPWSFTLNTQHFIVKESVCFKERDCSMVKRCPSTPFQSQKKEMQRLNYLNQQSDIHGHVPHQFARYVCPESHRRIRSFCRMQDFCGILGRDCPKVCAFIPIITCWPVLWLHAFYAAFECSRSDLLQTLAERHIV